MGLYVGWNADFNVLDYGVVFEPAAAIGAGNLGVFLVPSLRCSVVLLEGDLESGQLCLVLGERSEEEMRPPDASLNVRPLVSPRRRSEGLPVGMPPPVGE